MGRRGNGEGSITRHKKSGKWMARYWVETPEGRKRRTLYADTRKEVADKLAAALAEASNGLVYDAEDATLADYLTRWLEDCVRGSVRPTTHKSYAWLMQRHAIPAIGHIKLKKLTPAHLQGLYRAKLDGGLSPRTVQYLHVVLHRALKQALRWGLISRNPAEAVDPPKVRKEEMRPLSPEEARRFLEAAEGDRLEALYVLALTTGMRQGELLGLKWEDIDLDAATLTVRRTLTAAEGGRPLFSSPKTAKGRRSIRLTPGAVAALKAHKVRQAEEKLRSPLWKDYGLVFTTEAGTPIDRHNLIQRSFLPLLRRAGLPKIRFHDLRHTAATLLLSKGQHPKLVQELLGHSTIAITLDTYSHVLPGMGDTLAAAMEEALG
ncbi:Tyrosine recombinase XerC [Rubrobacter xylanophilus DSM 9941]|uniref:Site-specific integrase n=1 Tax=Rubrobacter xylanophilus TaxID=49319 RepID=A0A510HER1_9ACTN|nr:site-specific integrase [Rubrobacter xylanophilus]QYJ17331.1 Tyrosine recombinase XerC [Rubrobacter xylanophilus DSM 9941]BBL78430.1 site-specific integrase [Rubrobacter xylanophilus]